MNIGNKNAVLAIGIAGFALSLGLKDLNAATNLFAPVVGRANVADVDPVDHVFETLIWDYGAVVGGNFYPSLQQNREVAAVRVFDIRKLPRDAVVESSAFTWFVSSATNVTSSERLGIYSLQFTGACCDDGFRKWTSLSVADCDSDWFPRRSAGLFNELHNYARTR